MSDLDPYVVQDVQTLVDPRSGQPTPEYRRVLEYQNIYLFNVWQFLTGGTGTVELGDLKKEIAGNEVLSLQALSTAIKALSKDEIVYYSVSSAHTTSDNEFVRVTAAATITLNANPDDGEEVWVQPSSDVTVTVSGDINDQTEYKIHRAYDVAHFKYIDDAGEWVIQ